MKALRILVPIVLVVAACSDSPAQPTADGVVAMDGFFVTEIVTGLNRPTQLTTLPDGRLLVAELNGGESDGDGRVVAIADDGTTETLFDQLLTPTGVAVLGEEIWVMEQRTLSRGPITGGALTPVLGSLPFNGRSETTLTPTPNGMLLYATTGSLADGTPKNGSGILWDHDRVGGSVQLAAGFKNAYAHTFDTDGRLWVTEMSDGSFDGSPAPDELVSVSSGVDHGWPSCVGDRITVEQYGGSTDECSNGPRSQAVFAPGATPTSVAVAPWDPEMLVVALWVERRIVTVPSGTVGIPHEPADLVTGDFRPQHLLADDERLLVVDHEGGRILAVEER